MGKLDIKAILHYYFNAIECRRRSFVVEVKIEKKEDFS